MEKKVVWRSLHEENKNKAMDENHCTQRTHSVIIIYINKQKHQQEIQLGKISDTTMQGT
jgi:hypothetical protein